MSLPTGNDILTFLEGYGITSQILTTAWLENRRDGFVVPYVERITRQSFSGVATVTEYYSGNGKNILILNRKPVVSVTEIRYVLGSNNISILNLGNIEVVQSEGILKAKRNYEESFYLPVFAKGDYNIKVTYTYGYVTCPADVAEAITYLCAWSALNFIGARTGGGSLSTQGYSRNYGELGKYTDILRSLQAQAHAILSPYMTSVIGN